MNRVPVSIPNGRGRPFRHRPAMEDPDGLMLFPSQTGEAGHLDPTRLTSWLRHLCSFHPKRERKII